MQTRKNANLAPESFRHSAVPRRLKHRARRRRRILCLLPVILVFGVLAAALLRFTPALAYADIFPAQATTRRIKDVPYISQLPTLPTGCESASAAMLLNYYGCTVTAEEFASYYLPTGDAPHTDENGELVGCDPWEAFPGDPFSETGWGCYSTVIERAMNEFLTNTGYLHVLFIGERCRFAGGTAGDNGIGAACDLKLDELFKLLVVYGHIRVKRGNKRHRCAGKNGFFHLKNTS